MNLREKIHDRYGVLPYQKNAGKATFWGGSGANNFLPCREPRFILKMVFARAHGVWTYEPREGRNAATAVCSTSAVVSLAF